MHAERPQKFVDLMADSHEQYFQPKTSHVCGATVVIDWWFAFIKLTNRYFDKHGTCNWNEYFVY